ncbi:MAG TPA: twin-arginine translocation signal domain-containing protein [Daejeonella sp.]|nr:twin-arginine translocation signal domain-containing protein [Daejeonella sp.]
MAHSSLTATSRRGFLGQFAAGAAAIGLSTLIAPLPLEAAEEIRQENSPDAWFNQIKGKHRMVFDVTTPHDVLPFAWPRVYLLTNEKTGTPEKDCSTVVVLRHEAIPYAMNDQLWQKYKFGEVFKINDAATKAPSVRNMFWKPKPGEMKVPGIGPVAIGINELQDSGVMFCVCNMALTVYSAVVAQNMKLDPAAVKNEWMAGILPKIQVVPSGVWAVDRAQEHNCSYCFVG